MSTKRKNYDNDKKRKSKNTHIDIEYDEDGDDNDSQVSTPPTSASKSFKRDGTKSRYFSTTSSTSSTSNTSTSTPTKNKRNTKEKKVEVSDEEEEEEEDLEEDHFQDESDESYEPSEDSSSSSSSDEIKKYNKKTSIKKQKMTKQEATKEIDIESSVKQPSLARSKWKEVWPLIHEMRLALPAPVDSSGCDSFNDPKLDPKVSRLHTLVGCMLSSQTRDEQTAACMTRLRKHGLTIEKVLATDQAILENLIYPVSFYKRKAEYLKRICTIMRDKYDGDIPPNFKEIMALPGIGQKMTNLIVQVAWGRTEGIAIDVHMHRICNRLGWVQTDTPEKTELALKEWLPFDRWDAINKLLVGFGQTICTPLRPKCDQCKVNHLCPVGIETMKAKTKKSTKTKKSSSSKKK